MLIYLDSSCLVCSDVNNGEIECSGFSYCYWGGCDGVLCENIYIGSGEIEWVDVSMMQGGEMFFDFKICIDVMSQCLYVGF